MHALVRLEKREGGDGKGEGKKEKSLLGGKRKVSPVWVCMNGLAFYSKDKSFIKTHDQLSPLILNINAV